MHDDLSSIDIKYDEPSVSRIWLSQQIVFFMLLEPSCSRLTLFLKEAPKHDAVCCMQNLTITSDFTSPLSKEIFHSTLEAYSIGATPSEFPCPHHFFVRWLAVPGRSAAAFQLSEMEGRSRIPVATLCCCACVDCRHSLLAQWW